MITLSNGLSIIRIPLAILFLCQNIYIRILVILLAMFTDSIDGYFARKYKSASRFGAFLDPAMDKFFVYFLLIIFLLENQIQLWQSLAMISRDFALILFGLFLAVTKRWPSYEIKPARWGKITTAMQFCVLIGFTLKFEFSWYIYTLFIILGFFSFIELLSNALKKAKI